MKTKKIDLKSYLPQYVRDEELSSLIEMFETVMNEFYDVAESKITTGLNNEPIQILPYEIEYDNKIKSIPMTEATKFVQSSPVKFRYGYTQPFVDSDDTPREPGDFLWTYNAEFPTDDQLKPIVPWGDTTNTNDVEYLNSTPPQHVEASVGYPYEFKPDNDYSIPAPFDSNPPINVNKTGYVSTATKVQNVGLYDTYHLPETTESIPQFTNYFTSGYSEPTPVMSISIFEKIHRLLDLKDPSLIDFEYIQYFAEHMGWNLNIGFDTLYNNKTNNILSTKFRNLYKQYEINEMIEQQVRSFIENLPYWYRIKTTESALQVILFSFGLVADVVKWYTEDYSTDRSNWDSANAFFNTANYRTSINKRNENIENFEDIPDGWFPTPHFSVRYDINNSFTLYTGLFKNENLFGKLVDTIMAIKPITTVFNGLTARLKTKSEYITTIYSVATSFVTSRTTTGYKNNNKWVEIPISNIE